MNVIQVPNMRFTLLLSFLVVSLPLIAYGQDQWKVIPDVSHVNFIIHSSLADTKGEAIIQTGEWSEFQNAASRFVFPIKQLKTRNMLMNRHMYEMFESDKYPQIIYNVNNLSTGTKLNTAQVNGSLTIHGVTIDFPITAKTYEKNGIKEFKGQADISLKSFGLKAPRFLMMKVADTVNVTFDIRMNKTLTSQNTGDLGSTCCAEDIRSPVAVLDFPHDLRQKP
ncbi:MAG: YceI family protein [Candidatus Omnitrophica bacterium]|nr:YceI family protein [Candidatus Omnitrophota bacterium]